MSTSISYSIIMALILIAVSAIILFVALRISFIFINYLFTRSRFRHKILRTFYFLQFALWFTFIVFAFNSKSLQPLVYNPVFITAAGVILLLFVLTAGKDIFAGIVLRTDESLALNNSIKTSIASGRIIKLGLRSATLEPVNGEAVRIPYSQLASSCITVKKSESLFREFEAELIIAPNNSPEETKRMITKNVLNSAYCSTTQTPNVTFLGEIDGGYNFKLTVTVMDEDYFNRLLFSLKKKFE
ncbi:MAG: mechanosensitive ion channel family protein [Ignavibacterium sp.]|nr:mechanosensitive ion channel family protein [Ignavibacterium sp.]